MTKKTKAIFVIAVLTGIFAVLVIFRYQQAVQTNNQHTRLVHKSSPLDPRMNRPKSELPDAPSAEATTKQPAKHTEYLPVSIETLKFFKIRLLEGDFKLSDNAIGALRLTPEEAKRVQNILTELKGQIQAYERSALKEIAPQDVGDGMILGFFKNNPGQQSAYQIPPMGDEEYAATLEWFSENVIQAVGQNRGEMLIELATGQNSDLALWLIPGVHVTLVFSDTIGADGFPRTAYYEETAGPHTGGGSSDTNFRDAVPPQWAFLFQENGRQRPGNEPSPVYTAVENNLKNIALSAMEYMKSKGVTEVTYQQLTGNPDWLLLPVTPVAGESYADVVARQPDPSQGYPSISVDVPGFGVVQYVP